jgi:hypothetical protein
MPKPVKKAKKTPAAKKRPSSDPVVRAKQVFDEHMAKLAAGKWGQDEDSNSDTTPPHGDPFEALYRQRMAELGRKGGKIGGKARLKTMTKAERRAVAAKAAKARWDRKRTHR